MESTVKSILFSKIKIIVEKKEIKCPINNSLIDSIRKTNFILISCRTNNDYLVKLPSKYRACCFLILKRMFQRRQLHVLT